ncbi:Zinc finger protein VAR3, chloroplastic [Dichanthelium oligosanthes]|uniref:Zinc finger protein VAR3, chloroplastic n=1 Tax=Dichanthelium oligosanthes TaxID=888268 RepID=A0A1E5WMP1_9POAL|nr:Zinc finger protein VAR3, chloroplastic [Dichanthelium oligosanthes]
MGGASKLLSSLLLTSSPLRLRPTTAAAALLLSPPHAASRRLLLLSSCSPLRTLSTSSAAAASSSVPHGSSSASPAPPPRAPFPEWSRLVDRLASAGYASRTPSPADVFALASGCCLSDAEEAAVSTCLAFARDRPDLLRSLPKKDVEVLVANAAPVLFKNGEDSAQRLRRYLAGEETDVIVSERAETVDIVRYLLSYTYSSSDSYSEDKELTDSAVRNIMAECSFMNFARNVRCLECNEQRPKKILTGGEWECPQCDFYNYGRNMSCLKCDCKRPATIPPNPSSAGAGLGGVAQLLNVSNAGKSDIERKLAENDEKAERWLSKVSQLDDSADLSSLAEDEDFPEIMPMRKGVNKFVVSTRKTPLERRLANAQDSSNNSAQTASSDSKISQTLDRILGRSKSTAPSNDQPGIGDALKQSTDHLSDIDPVPFVPLPADMFAKPQSNNVQGSLDGQINAEVDSSTANSPVPLPERRDGMKSSHTAEKWSKKVAELDSVNDVPSATSDEYVPEIMPMRKGENRFVVSKKKDRSLTSPQYKRRSLLEHADNSDFVPFVPFPPGYFAKKDKPVESTAETGIVSEGSPASEKRLETNASSGKFGNSSNTSQVVGSQPKGNMNNENWNRNYSQQNSSSGGYVESNNYQHQSQSHGPRSWPSGYTGKSLEGSAVKDPDPLDMSEEAKAERWFRRAAQIKDISELANIPDEDFPEIMPMRKGVNRFVVSKRKTPLERRTELCRFSGQKIYPGKGIRFIRADSQVFLFANSKCKRYFHNRLKPAKLTWTAMYRKQHKKDIHAEAVKKRRRTTKKPYSRSIVGATLEVIQKKRSEKPEVRDAAREAALREIKERIKKTKDEKKAKKAEVAKSQKTQTKGGAAQKGPKGPKIGGGGGKR